MSPSTEPLLTEDQARDIINGWNDQRLFRIKYLGDKIFIKEIVPLTAYTVQLRTQYEDRSVRQASVAFAGGRVDQAGVPPGPWEVPVKRPADFEKRTETLPVPHTDRVQMCPQCAGQGKVGCRQCGGSGRAPCMSCGGTGYRERQEMRSERDLQGNVSMRPVAFRERCSCDGGRVTCSACSGNGRITCSTCAGSGQVKTFEQLTVQFRPEAQAAVLDPTEVPDDQVARMSGEVMIDERAARIEQVLSVMPDVDRSVQQLLQKAQAHPERKTRLLFQHLHVERLTIHEVRYQYAGVDRQLWICGNEKYVYAPGAPRQWRKLVLLVAAGGLAAAVIIVALVMFIYR
jgi:hypothetical protein